MTVQSVRFLKVVRWILSPSESQLTKMLLPFSSVGVGFPSTLLTLLRAKRLLFWFLFSF